MLTLEATIRRQIGKKSKKLRRENKLPGVLYGRKVKKSLPVSIDYKEFERVYKEAGESSLVSLKVDRAGETAKDFPEDSVVLIRDVVTHPLLDSFVHVDFYQVPMDEKITVSIPLVFENEAPAVKSEGAVLVRNIYEVDVSAFPKDLPSEIKVDLSSLEHIEDAISVKSLHVPDGVDIEAEEDMVVAYVNAPAEEEVIEEQVTEVAPEDIKTESEEKREKKEREESDAEEAGE